MLKAIEMCDGISQRKVPMTGWQPPKPMKTGSPEYIGKEAAHMTAYEIIMIFLGILALLISFGGLVVALLAFLDKRSKRKNNTPPV